MSRITSQQIAHYRSQLASNEMALIALDMIENCEGDLEDAALSLAIQTGQQPDRNEWLDGLAKRCRVPVCQGILREELLNNQIAGTVNYLNNAQVCHPILSVLVVIYVVKYGVDQFCNSLNYKLS